MNIRKSVQFAVATALAGVLVSGAAFGRGGGLGGGFGGGSIRYSGPGLSAGRGPVSGVGAGAVQRSYGAASIRGPAAGYVGAPVRRPGGYGVAGYRGPNSPAALARLPEGSASVVAGGATYWRNGYAWYQPHWYGGNVQYGWVYPPVGTWVDWLPDDYVSVRSGGRTYFYYDGVYYANATQNNRGGYVVVASPADESSPQASAGGPDPTKILRDMCDYIARAERFTAVLETTTEEVLASGAKIELSQRRALYVVRPDKFALEESGDGDDKRFVYDGKTIGMLDTTKNAYAVAPMPGTLDGMLDTLTTQYGVTFPLGDLMTKNAYESVAWQTTSNQYVGRERVGGFDCHHLVFAGDAVDWQIWIEAGARPVPRKIIIDRKDDSARPRFQAMVVGWVENPVFRAGLFEFRPPAGATEIKVVPASARSGAPAAGKS